MPSSDVALAWTKVGLAVEEDKLLCAKVSTRSAWHRPRWARHYTRDWADRRDLMRALAVLRSPGFVKELGYKRDVDTRSGKYGPDEWHLRA